MFCWQCGENIPDDSKFCEKCGVGLEKKGLAGSTIIDKPVKKVESVITAPSTGTSEKKKKKSLLIPVITGCILMFFIAGALTTGVLWWKVTDGGKLSLKSGISSLLERKSPPPEHTSSPTPGLSPCQPSPELVIRSSPDKHLTFGVGAVNNPQAFVDVREGPGSNYEIITRIYDRERFLIVSRDGEWWNIVALTVTTGIRGYVHKSKIKLIRTDAVGTGTTDDTQEYTNIFSSPSKDSEVVTKVQKGEMFIILSYGSWNRILSWEGKEGYLESRKISNVFPQKI